MAAKKTKADAQGNPLAFPTGTVQARLAAEAERQAQASAVRAAVVKETKAAHKATADFLASKPTDSRKIADTRNVVG